MEKITKVSIIIPIYNTGEKLVRCLESVLNQTYDDFECLMVDDGSKDQSPRIIDEFASKDSRFIAIHKPNGGVSSARNEGLKAAKGEWVVFLDSDDSIKPNHLEAMLSIVEDGVDIIFTGYEQNIEENKIVRGHQYEHHVYHAKDGIEEFLDSTDVLSFMIPWDRMYRRSVIKNHNLKFDTNLSLSEDRLFCYDYLLYAEGITTIPDITYVHDASDQNTLSFRRYPFSVNAYRYDIFVDATNKILNAFDLSDHAIFLLWRYTWDLMYLTLSSLYGFKKNIFTISRQQKNFYQEHFDFEMYQKNKDNAEIKDFSESKQFRIILSGKFLKWNLSRSVHYLLYKFHISK